MIYKVLVGNEHGGAASSSKAIIDNFIKDPNFRLVLLCENCFSQFFNKEDYISLKSFSPPIINDTNYFKKIINFFKFIVWIIYTSFLMIQKIKKENIKVIHTTNNHALLICLISKLFTPNLYIVSHWRCVGLASSNNYKKLLCKIDKIICISKEVKLSLPSSLRKKSIIIYNGVNVNNIYTNNNINKNKLKELVNFKKGDVLLGTIGSYTTIKCHELIINTFIKYKISTNYKVALIGSCPNKISENYFNYLKNKVIENNLDKIIYFIEDKQLNPPKYYIGDLDLFIGATWNNGLGEGFGLIYVESMASGVPVLAINVGAAKEIIQDNYNGFLINKNCEKELFEKLNYITARFKMNKQEQILSTAQRFDISLTISKIRQLYGEIS